MGEVTREFITNYYMLIAVFVPVALFPGPTGRMYQQFALTIAFSIAISAVSALTLAPALSALLLRPGRPKNRLFSGINTLIRKGTAGYTASLSALSRSKLAVVIVFFAGLALTYWIYRRVPTSFVPDEDQGYVMAAV